MLLVFGFFVVVVVFYLVMPILAKIAYLAKVTTEIEYYVSFAML